MSSEQPKAQQEYIITKNLQHFIIGILHVVEIGNPINKEILHEAIEQLSSVSLHPRPHPAPETKQAYRNGYDDGYVLAMNEAGEKIRKAREDVQPFIDFVRVISTKRNEMLDLMCRNKIKIDNLDDPMQKLAFTFYSEIGEMAHKAEVIIEESTHQQAGDP